jgi:hypothetical protein
MRVPVEAARFEVELEPMQLAAKRDDEAQGFQFRGVAHSGKPILGHWFWGNLIIDLAGLSIGRQDKPVMLDHQEILGFSRRIAKDEQGVTVEGTLLDVTESQKETLAMMRAGMPFQMSVYIPPRAVKAVGEGEEVVVNGHKLRGPGHVITKSVLRETTITALGADEHTSAALLAEAADVVVELREQDENKMAEKTSDAAPDAAAAEAKLAAERAQAQERDRVSKILNLATGVDTKLVQQAIDEGWTFEQAATKFTDFLRERKEARLEAIREQTPKPSGQVDVETYDEAGKKKGGGTPAKAAPAGGKSDDDLRAEFAASEELQEEFAEVGDYLALMRHEARAAARAGR